MKIERQLSVPADPQDVWGFFVDVPALAETIPGCVGVQQGDRPDRYTADVQVSVGRFRVQFQLTIDVVESGEGESMRARAQGRDRLTRSTMVSELEFHVAPDGNGGALVALTNDFQVFGRLGSLGHGVIQRRSEDLMEEFAENLRARLAADGQPAADRDRPARVGAPTPEREARG